MTTPDDDPPHTHTTIYEYRLEGSLAKGFQQRPGLVPWNSTAGGSASVNPLRTVVLYSDHLEFRELVTNINTDNKIIIVKNNNKVMN